MRNKTQKQIEDAIQESCRRELKDKGIPLLGGLTPRKGAKASTKKAVG